MSNQAKSEQTHDDTLKETFPASDPPANSGITGAEVDDKPAHDRGIEEIPTGTPTSDRHATETAHHDEHEVKPNRKPKG